jgi:hypothetical protein
VILTHQAGADSPPAAAALPVLDTTNVRRLRRAAIWAPTRAGVNAAASRPVTTSQQSGCATYRARPGQPALGRDPDKFMEGHAGEIPILDVFLTSATFWG